MKLRLSKNRLNPHKNWKKAIPDSELSKFTAGELALFDQNGYDLTVVERAFAAANGYVVQAHRDKFTCKTPWFRDLDAKTYGPHLNHADLYFRHGFAGAALKQLEERSKVHPIFHKFTQMRPKWGIDISVDYADFDGNVFELLHFEWDGFDLIQVTEQKLKVEKIVKGIDFDAKAQEMLDRKKEWHHLDFFGQSDWKQAFWGLPKENFKEVIWR